MDVGRHRLRARRGEVVGVEMGPRRRLRAESEAVGPQAGSEQAGISKEETHQIIQIVNSNTDSNTFDANSFETTEDINLVADPDD